MCTFATEIQSNSAKDNFNSITIMEQFNRFKLSSDKNPLPIIVEEGHTKEELKTITDDVVCYWDFPLEELLDGTVEPNKEMIYWLIDGRLYETPFVKVEEVNETNSDMDGIIEIYGEIRKLNNKMRPLCYAYLNKILAEHNNHLKLSDKWALLPAVTYCASEGEIVSEGVNGIKKINDKIFLDVDASSEYDIVFITDDELYNLCRFIDIHFEP